MSSPLPPSPALPTPPDRAPIVFLVVCAALALLVRLPMLGRSVWFDEACMSSQRIGTFDQLLATLYVDIHPPLFVTFMHGIGRLFGDGELALRLPALLTGLATIPTLWWTGHRLVGDRAARWATLLLALSPVHVWYSTEARLYAPMVLLTLLAFGTTERLCDSRRTAERWLWPLHVAVVVAMLGLHYYLAVIVVALAAAAQLLTRQSTLAGQRILLWHGLLLLLLAGFVLIKQRIGQFETSQDYLRTLTANDLVRLLVRWCWAGNCLAPIGGAVHTSAALVFECLGGLLLVAGLVASWRGPDRRRGALVVLGMLLLPTFLLVLGWLGYGRTYMERSVIPSLPFVLLLAGSGLASLSRLLQRCTGGLAVLLAAASLASLYQHHENAWLVYKPNVDWRSVAAWLGHEIEHGGAGRAVYTPTPNPRPLSYYDERIQDVKNLRVPRTPEQFGNGLRKDLGSAIGDFAEQAFRRFAAHNEELLAKASLRVYRSVADPTKLQLADRSRDDVCYLVRDHWHPHRTVDDTVERLLTDPRVEVLATGTFPGISVHKVRVRP